MQCILHSKFSEVVLHSKHNPRQLAWDFHWNLKNPNRIKEESNMILWDKLKFLKNKWEKWEIQFIQQDLICFCDDSLLIQLNPLGLIPNNDGMLHVTVEMDKN